MQRLVHISILLYCSSTLRSMLTLRSIYYRTRKIWPDLIPTDFIRMDFIRTDFNMDAEGSSVRIKSDKVIDLKEHTG